MNKGRIAVVVVAVLVQLILGMLYGFSVVKIPALGSFIIWCACAVAICRMVEAPETV